MGKRTPEPPGHGALLAESVLEAACRDLAGPRGTVPMPPCTPVSQVRRVRDAGLRPTLEGRVVKGP